jgi:hypothetical protein
MFVTYKAPPQVIWLPSPEARLLLLLYDEVVVEARQGRSFRLLDLNCDAIAPPLQPIRVILWSADRR